MRLNCAPEELKKIATRIRQDVVESIYLAGSGHPGGSLSLGEILTVLYFHTMNIDPQNPQWEERDRFVLSKGHGAPALYAALAERGYFPVEKLRTLRKIDSNLQGHPDMRKVPGVDMSTGSLGQGISAACGMAYFAKNQGKSYRVYCVLGDGEIQEGVVWEAAMSAGHFKLDNLTVLLDNNNLQIDGNVDQVMNIYPIKEKFEAFGWRVLESDGHQVEKLLEALQEGEEKQDRPLLIICRTVKGKGVTFMENQVGWHGSAINEEQYETARKELGR